ncbi:MAG: NAD(P)H-dependent oxidoreductase [Anaerolineae bacterium]|nr:NAD(P)H-dependent oxidoreductase [Phycisphaerae bacterium]
MNITIISCSLNPDSRSRVLANSAAEILRKHEATVQLLDLREHPLPMCDGESCDPVAIAPLRDAILKSDAILLAVPIYNYDVNAAAKNLVEQTGKAWEGKSVGFLCAAGGHGSYMSVMSLANSLMLDFRSLIVPRFVYAVGKDFDGDEIASPKIRERIEQLCSETARLAKALRSN